LNKQISALQKEKDRTSSDLETARKKLDVADLRKNQLEKEKLDVAAELKKYKQDLADAFNKNKRLQAEVERMPKKFTEIARQNERLVKETGEMHYNLGVFYTKGREYKRAIAEFEKAIEINPNDSYSHFNLGYIYAEYMVNRKKAVENFRHYLRLAKGDDKDVDWAKQYILTWETYEGKRPME
ncbi:MAG: tetratricopeptide repeat protein, partial [Candidatus Omnitrophota bacterium]